jgi:hypothetical protein
MTGKDEFNLDLVTGASRVLVADRSTDNTFEGVGKVLGNIVPGVGIGDNTGQVRGKEIFQRRVLKRGKFRT